MLPSTRVTPLSTSSAEAATAITSEKGDLLTLVAKLVSSMPMAGTQGYDVPTSAEAAQLGTAFGYLTSGDVSKAASVASALSYRVVRYTDSATGRALLMLRENQRSDGSWPHAWGTYVLDPASRSTVIVEVVHPRADAMTEDVGLRLFRTAGARAFLLAGAHRDANADGSADPAHAPVSALNGVHLAIIGAGSRVIQPHGFSSTAHPELGDAVVSSGTSSATSLSTSVVTSMRTLATVCSYGTDCTELGATTNVEGASTRKIGGSFVHTELAPRLRADSTIRQQTAAAIARGLAAS